MTTVPQRHAITVQASAVTRRRLSMKRSMLAAALVSLAVTPARAREPLRPSLAEIKLVLLRVGMNGTRSAIAEKMPKEQFRVETIPEISLRRRIGERHVATRRPATESTRLGRRLEDSQCRGGGDQGGGTRSQRSRDVREICDGARGLTRSSTSAERDGGEWTIQFPTVLAVAAREHDRAFQQRHRVGRGLSQATKASCHRRRKAR